ncbi:MAG: AbrB/MazE/SpoVT family DNA-binding domain-containing protein [Bacteroidota bacterium]
MHIPIVQIGNSKGIRLAKTVLTQYELTDQVELILADDCIILKPVKKAREGWDEAFQSMAAQGDDELLFPDVFADEEWEPWDV